MLTTKRPAGDRPRVLWHRSLYWRIALGYVLSIALLLIAQLAVFVKLADYRDQSNETERLERLELTQTLSRELSRSLDSSPDANLATLVAALHTSEHVFVIMRDGTIAGHRYPDRATVRIVVDGLARIQRADEFPDAWSKSGFGGAPVFKGGVIVGALGIMPPTTFERYSATIAVVAIALLITGTVFLSLIIVGPIRSRLRELQAAAARLRDGDLTARAQLDDKDEIADVAQVFNEMATELSRRTMELETSDRLRRQLIADVSHELMTPLTAVLGHLETLTMEDVDSDKAERLSQVSIATREARRLERLIGDLLNTARLETGGTPLDFQDVGVRALFEQVASRHEHECRSRRITMTCSIPTHLTAIHADPFRIEQALENLVVNALRHTPEGGSITLSANHSASGVTLQVQDSGDGIAPEHLPYVFDRFYKAASADGIASPGSGLGLSIVKAIVTRHGGQVSATSTVGAGTTVTIELPLAPAAAS